MECTLLCPAVAHATVLTPTSLLDKRSHHTRRREVAVVSLVRASTSATFDRYGVRGVVDYVVIRCQERSVTHNYNSTNVHTNLMLWAKERHSAHARALRGTPQPFGSPGSQHGTLRHPRDPHPRRR